MVFAIAFASAAASADGVVIDVDRVFVEAFKITTLRPEPTLAMATANGLRMRFATAPGEPATILLYVSPERVGLSRPRLGLNGRTPVELPVFIYP